MHTYNSNVGGGSVNTVSVSIKEFFPSLDAPEEIFVLDNTKTVIKVENNGTTLMKSEWSQNGDQLTVAPINGGLMVDGYVLAYQQ